LTVRSPSVQVPAGDGVMGLLVEKGAEEGMKKAFSAGVDPHEKA
jgi:hypothetical protein